MSLQEVRRFPIYLSVSFAKGKQSPLPAFVFCSFANTVDWGYSQAGCKDALLGRGRLLCDQLLTGLLPPFPAELWQGGRERKEPECHARRRRSAGNLRPVQAGDRRRLQHGEARLPRLQGQIEVGGVERPQGHVAGGREAGVRRQGAEADRPARSEVEREKRGQSNTMARGRQQEDNYGRIAIMVQTVWPHTAVREGVGAMSAPVVFFLSFFFMLRFPPFHTRTPSRHSKRPSDRGDWLWRTRMWKIVAKRIEKRRQNFDLFCAI